MHVGCYDAPFRDLPSYRARLQKLCELGFRSVGLAIDWDDHPRDQTRRDTAAMLELLREHDATLRLHPDLGKLQTRGRGEDLLDHARRELEPLLEWALELGVVSICCDSIRADLDATVALFRLLIDLTAGTQLQLGVENSQRGVINSPEMMNEAVHRVGDPRMGLLVDVGHVNTTIHNGWNDCASAAEFLAGLKVPIWDTHIHNNDGSSDGHLTLRDPAGTLDLSAIVAGFQSLGYGGPLQMECAPKNRAWSQEELSAVVVDDRRYLEGLIGGP